MIGAAMVTLLLSFFLEDLKSESLSSSLEYLPKDLQSEIKIINIYIFNGGVLAKITIYFSKLFIIKLNKISNIGALYTTELEVEKAVIEQYD